MFEGSMVAIVTPFKNGKVDDKALRELIEFQIAGGTGGIVPCGTTGESATLSHAEHDEVIGITVDACKGRAKVLAGTGSNSTWAAAELTEHAEKAGVDGSVTIAEWGVGEDINTVDIKDPIIGFMFNNKGLMYNLTIEGSKFSKIAR